MTIKEIRTAIFDLEQSKAGREGLRARVLAVAREAATPLGFEPRMLLDGPIDTGVDARVGDELVATLREALSNVARHARATRVDVEVEVSGDVSLRVSDNGVGPPANELSAGNGLRNMGDRAAMLGGTLELRPAPAGGTVLEWRAPKG